MVGRVIDVTCGCSIAAADGGCLGGIAAAGGQKASGGSNCYRSSKNSTNS